MSKVSDFLVWLGGADLGILRQAPRDRGRYVAMGCVLLSTASVATVSMTFAVHNTMGAPVPIAFLFGFCWGLVILNLDRFLVVSMGSIRDKKKLFWAASPRFLMAVVVSLVIATPITLEIFRSDIYAQITTMNQQQSQQVAAGEAKTALQQRFNTVQAKITGDQATLDGKLPDNVTSPQVQQAQAQVNALQPQVQAAWQAENKAQTAYECELYGIGCAGGSGKSGYGPIAQAKKRELQQATATYNSLNGQLKQAKDNLKTASGDLDKSQATSLARYQQAARQELPGLKQQLATLQTQIEQQDNFDQANVKGNTGILRQLVALFKASADSPVLLLAHLAVAALFFLIEVLPVVSKILLNAGSVPTAYEQILKAADDKLVEAKKQERRDERRKRERESDEEKQKADADSQARLTQALDMSSRQADLGLKANDVVAKKMEEILDAALAQWSAQVQAMLNGGQVPVGQQPASHAPGSGNGPGHGNAAGSGYPPPGYGYPPGSGYAPGHGYAPGNGYAPAGQAAYRQPTISLPPSATTSRGGNGAQPPGLGPGADPGAGFGLPDPGDLL